MSASDQEQVLKILTDPKVYLVGQQVTDESAIAEFLQDHEVEQWTTDTEMGGEKLVEVAGRLCYMSFAKPRPGGESCLHSPHFGSGPRIGPGARDL